MSVAFNHTTFNQHLEKAIDLEARLAYANASHANLLRENDEVVDATKVVLLHEPSNKTAQSARQDLETQIREVNTSIGETQAQYAVAYDELIGYLRNHNPVLNVIVRYVTDHQMRNFPWVFLHMHSPNADGHQIYVALESEDKTVPVAPKLASEIIALANQIKSKSDDKPPKQLGLATLLSTSMRIPNYMVSSFDHNDEIVWSEREGMITAVYNTYQGHPHMPTRRDSANGNSLTIDDYRIIVSYLQSLEQTGLLKIRVNYQITQDSPTPEAPKTPRKFQRLAAAFSRVLPSSRA